MNRRADKRANRERSEPAGIRLADVQLAFPVIMLAIAIVAVVGTSPAALVSVLALSLELPDCLSQKRSFRQA